MQTKIERDTQHLMTVEMYAAKLLIVGRGVTSRTLRNKMDQLKAGEITPLDAGFRVHTIAGKDFIEDTSVAPAGKPFSYTA